MSTYASVDDVTDRWDGAATTDRIQTLLDDAETILGFKVSDLADRLTAGTTDPGMLTIVLVRVVTALLNNPMGYKGEHAGEVGYYYGSDKRVPGQLGFTRADLADLGLKVKRAGTIRIGLEPAAYASGRYLPETTSTAVDAAWG